VLAGLVDLAARRPWALLGANGLFLAIVLGVSIAGAGSLPIGSTAPSGSASGQPDLIVATTGRVPVRSPVYRVALRVISSQVEADSAVASVRQGPVAADRRSTALMVSLGGGAADRQDAVERIETGIDPGPLTVTYGGEVAALLDARRDLASDLWVLELAAMPFVALVLILALGARLAAAPVICAGTAIAGALAGLILLGLVADVSLLGIAPAAVVGLVLGVEAPCALFARFRAEATRAPREQALGRAVRATADLAIPTAIAASLVTIGLVATSLEQVPSMIVACALATLLALASTLVSAASIAWLAESDRHATGAAPVAAWLVRVPARLAARLTGSGRAATAAMVLGAGLMVAAAVPLAHAEGQGFPGGGGDAIFGDLPIAAAVAALVLAVVLGVAFSARLAAPVAVVSLLPAAAACGLCVLVFQDGQGALENGAVASLLAALASVSAARSASAMHASQEATAGGLEPGWGAQWTASLLVPGAIVASLIGAAMTGVLLGASLAPAREFGFAVAAGLLLDLIVVRLPLIAALARRGPG
jgi:uncharacterized membrane protein YdfJ with MMPL/SSD domain